MFHPPSNPGRPAQAGTSRGRVLSVLELTVLLEELDSVVGDLEAAMAELALPFDEPSLGAARAAIAAASRRGA